MIRSEFFLEAEMATEDQAENATEEVKVIGSSGQISLGKRFAGKRLKVEYREDGSILLTPVVVIPESQLWTLQEPDASKIRRGLEWARRNPPRETDLEGLLAREEPPKRPTRRKASRGSR